MVPPAAHRICRAATPRSRRWRVPCLLAVAIAVALVRASPPQQQVTPPALPDLRVPPPAPLATPDLAPTRPGGPALPWEVALDTTLSASPAGPPVLAADLVIVPLRTGHLSAVALADGSARWTTTLSLPALLAATAVLVIAAEPDSLSARHVTTGDIAWRVPTNGAASAVAVDGAGLIVAGFASGALLAVRHDTGAAAWRVEVAAPVTRVCATATGFVAGLSSGAVVAIGPAGAVRWARQLSGSVSALGATVGAVFAGSTDNFLYKLKDDRGEVDWRWRTGGDLAGTPIVAGRRVYFVSLDTVLRALDAGQGAQQWKRGLASRPMGGPLLLGDVLIVTGVGPVIEGFALSNGRPLGRLEQARELVAPVAAWRDGTGATSLVALSRTGQLQRYVAKAPAPAGPPPVSAPPPGPAPPPAPR